MNAPIIEIFSSFQGEGILIGRRQIFIRFAGCNLSCKYCDTIESQSVTSGTELSVEETIKKVKALETSDLHSISFTGGEPLLYVDFINEFMDKTDYNFLLETNGTLPDFLSKINQIDYVSLDIKLPEHFDNEMEYEIFEDEIKSLKLLIEHNINIYCKVVVLPSTESKTIKMILERLKDEIPKNSNIPIVIQPSSPINKWKIHTKKLFEFSEIIGDYLDVLMIPQVHKILDIE
ncbi:7-carboxy-7-deazaguanine synthase [Methanobrevibacter cuticularis]|uniref:7-carboxy-7-deazaguanine synthase n=1 Tax=Methanobrevibacter cuticularis TaxID=47311 RepID=A0A166FGD9_9EURY|nr:7-carboxy-7-deazaguanine synthase QueE [Methanobrevibacter cuticularis]KZX17645.1 7-carboxy-7-deazaguanine synthase [Methanobrevibacter cuticularis]